MVPRLACACYHPAEGARRAAVGPSRGTTESRRVQRGRSAGATGGPVMQLSTMSGEDVVRFFVRLGKIVREATTSAKVRFFREAIRVLVIIVA